MESLNGAAELRLRKSECNKTGDICCKFLAPGVCLQTFTGRMKSSDVFLTVSHPTRWQWIR